MMSKYQNYLDKGMRLIRYYYYRLYLYYAAQGSGPMVSTFLAIFTFAFINGLTLLCIYTGIFPEQAFQIPVAKSGWKRLLPALYILPALGFFMYHFQRGYHEKIMKEFEGETKHAKKISRFWVVSYLVGSIIVFFLSLELLRK